MTPALLDRPTIRARHPVPHDGVTLEELLNSALQEAAANGSTECPVCHARMTYTRAPCTRARESHTREETAGRHAVARVGRHAVAECGGCGSRLG